MKVLSIDQQIELTNFFYSLEQIKSMTLKEVLQQLRTYEKKANF